MVVCKFGGAVLATPGGFAAMASIVSAQARLGAVVVVSALGATTRLLDWAIEEAREANLDGARAHVAEIDRIHRSCIDGLGASQAVYASLLGLLERGLAELTMTLRSVSTTRQCTPRVRDRILSWGERLSREIASEWLGGHGLAVRGVAARTVIVTSGEYGCASPLSEETARRARMVISPLLSQGEVVVIEGFVGQTVSGDITTMGRESSNLTATLIGAALNAEMVTIYTDVEGVRSSDPHYVVNTAIRAHLSYAQARIAAQAGVKLLYPTMMEPAERAHIPVRIASAMVPQGESTVIDHSERPAGPIVVGVDLGNGTHRCSVVYVEPLAFLVAITAIMAELHDCSEFDVITNVASRRADVIIASVHAATVLDRLHTTLCLEVPKP